MKNVIYLTIILFLSCGTQKMSIITVSTDLPEVIPLIEEFNRQNVNIKLILESTKTSGDIVIFHGQPEESPYKTANIESIFETVDRSIFYKDILNKSINRDGSITLIPLSFNLSGLMYNRSRFKNEGIIKISDFLEDHSIKFSPFWNRDFIMWYYLSNMPSFNEKDNYLDKPLFYSTGNKMLDIINKATDKWDSKLFNKKYMYLSPQMLIKSNIIEYYYTTFSNYINMRDSYKKDISFSFISSNNLLMVGEDLTYIGIIDSSKNKKTAMAILNWILNSDNQTAYITKNLKESSKSNLFLNELSTIIEVSETSIPKLYPAQVPFIPDHNMITVPMFLPKQWKSIKEELFIPIFKDMESVPKENWDERYQELYNEWLKKHIK